MFSKPLFKQSCKANILIWSLVTFATCFMLAAILLIMGNSDASEIRNSMVDMFTDSYVNSEIDKNAMTYYDMTRTALSGYEEKRAGLDALLAGTGDNYEMITGAYAASVDAGDSDETARQKVCAATGLERNVVDSLIEYYLSNGNDLSDEKRTEYVLDGVAAEVYDQVLAEYGEESAEQAKMLIATAIEQFVTSEDNADFFATRFISDMLGEQMPPELEKEGLLYTAEEISAEARSAILSFRAELSLDPQQDTAALIERLSKNMLDELPENVQNSLVEIKDLDMFGLIVGSIFFKMAGLLLPIVYTIMVANNLIAGQVDSGSMAYVLSTPTKRRQVTLTQMSFLILSLLAMFSFTTLTGIVCLATIDTSVVTITYGQLILFNLGAFVTMFAISGICFLASAWFNRSKESMGVGGGLSMFFLVATILGLFGSHVIPSAIRIEAMNYFNYVTLISLFDSASILAGSLTWLWKLGILAVIGIIAYVLSVVQFEKKDLPL